MRLTLLLIFLGLLAINAKHIGDDPDVCKTPACELAGKALKANLNESVDPCDDFYEFACGGWEATHTIPADHSSYSSFDILDDDLQKSIKDQLQNTVQDKSQSVVYSAELYRACIDEATRNARGVAPLAESLKSVGGWPIAGVQSCAQDSADYDWRQAFAKLVSQFSLSPIFAVSIQPDANDTVVHRVYYDAAQFGLGRNQLVNQTAYPDIVNAYYKYILQSAVLLGAKDDDQTHKDIDDLLAFESKLASLSTPQEKRRDANVWYNRMTFTAFNKLSDNKIDWISITNKIYENFKSPISVKPDELVIVQDIPYLKAVSQLLDKTPGRVVANYMGWMMVMNLGSYTTKQFRDIQFNFDKVVSGIEKQQELWQTCVSSLMSGIQYPVSRLYLDKNFSPKDKQEAVNIINDIKVSYNELIKESDWLDADIKNKSLYKLNAMTINIGYPDWILNPAELDKYYNLKQKVDVKKSYEGFMYLQTNGALRTFKSLREPVNLTLSWPMPPAMVNAAYEPTQNSITFPAGILRTPFFDSKRPVELNYGAIGLVIGHEMTHGFDDEGSQFDAKGNLVNWWTKEIHQKFDQKADCFIKEYSDVYVPEVKMHLNGKNTVGENIADNGGMRESYRAFQMYVQKHGEPQRLPYVSQYTPEQQYFLSHANVWCSLFRLEALKTQIEYNPHSPGKYRVDVPVSNFKPFSDAFKCSSTSRMNPKNKCILW